MLLDRTFVETWSARYGAEELGPLESRLFTEVGPRMRERGHATSSEVAEIIKWKSLRSSGLYRRNPDQDVIDITAVAFAAPPGLRHRFLGQLSGVRTPVASAILTVWDPVHHTIIDRYTTASLDRLGYPDVGDDYPTYNEFCRQHATSLDLELRTLDRALWKWAKHGHPAG